MSQVLVRGTLGVGLTDVNSFSDISIDISIFIHSSEVVLFYYFLRYDFVWKTNIFITFYGGAQIKILDVSALEAHFWI